MRENVLAGADTSEHQLTNSGTGKLAMFLQLRAGIDCIACPAAVSDMVVVSRVWARADAQPSRPDRRHERLNADDVHYPRKIVGEHVQCHLGRNLRQAIGYRFRNVTRR